MALLVKLTERERFLVELLMENPGQGADWWERAARQIHAQAKNGRTLVLDGTQRNTLRDSLVWELGVHSKGDAGYKLVAGLLRKLDTADTVPDPRVDWDL